MFREYVYQNTRNILRKQILLNHELLEKKRERKKKISKDSNNHPEWIGIVSKYFIYHKQASSLLGKCVTAELENGKKELVSFISPETS